MVHWLEAVGWTLALNLPIAGGAYLAARRGFGQPAGLPAALAAAVLAWAWITAGLLILGPMGVATRGPLLGWSVVGLGVGVGLSRLRRDDDAPAPDDGWRWEGMAAIALTLWPAAIMGFRTLFLPVKVMSDGPIYHLWFAARWWQEGRLFLVAAPFGESVATYFPCGGDLWFWWLMIGEGGGNLAKVGQLPFLLLASLAVFALARRLGAGVNAAAVATAWYATMTPSIVFTVEPNVDTMFVAGYVLAVYFFVRHGLGDGAAALALGSIAAGLCWGTKPSGLVFVPPLIALAGMLVVRRAGSWKGTVAHLAVLAMGPVLMAGYWYAGNWVRSGNPLYPLQVDLFGRTILTGWHGRAVMSESPYFIDPRDTNAMVDMLLQVFEPRQFPLWLASITGAWAIGRRRDAAPDTGRWIAGVACLAVLNIAIYWLAIPYRTQQRFLFHSVAIAAVPLAALLDRARWLQWLGVGLLAVHTVTPMAWPWAGANEHGSIPWDRSEWVPNALPAPVLLPWTPSDWSENLRAAEASGLNAYLQLFAPVVLGVLAAVVGWSTVRWARREGRGRAVGWAASVALMLGLGGACAFPWGVSPAFRFYPVFQDYIRGWLALESVAGDAGANVAYSGTNLPYYLLGTGLRNHVRYVNVDAHRGWLLHDYHRLAVEEGRPNWPDPRPGWDRERAEFGAWLGNLEADRIHLVVVARHNAGEDWPVEKTWAESHPDRFTPVYGAAEQDPLFRIYRLPRQKVSRISTDGAAAGH